MITYIPTLGLVLLAGILFGVSARSVQHSPVTNLACRNPVTVTLTLNRGIWYAQQNTRPESAVA